MDFEKQWGEDAIKGRQGCPRQTRGSRIMPSLKSEGYGPAAFSDGEQVEPSAPSAGPDQSVGESLLHNRVRDIAVHIPWYGFKTQVRLARDSGVSPAAISRLIRGNVQPSLCIALRVAAALSQRLGRPLDVAEVFSLDGSFPTPSVCHLTGCRKCLPPAAYDADENLKPEYREALPGHWSQPTVNRQGGR